MTRHNKGSLTLFGILMLGGLLLGGCSSSPSAEELQQLNMLKDQTASLQRDIASKEQTKATLEKEIADKNAKLKKCKDDQQVVKQRLGK